MEIKCLCKIIQIWLEPTNPVLQAYVRVHLTNVLIDNGSLKRPIYVYIWGIIFTYYLLSCYVIGLFTYCTLSCVIEMKGLLVNKLRLGKSVFWYNKQEQLSKPICRFGHGPNQMQTYHNINFISQNIYYNIYSQKSISG